MIQEITNCRNCGGKIYGVLSLGEILNSDFVSDQNNYTGQKVPLDLVMCQDCGLVQLQYTVELDEMYKKYWYRSGLNKSMVGDLKNIVEDINKHIELKDGDLVIDIGTNDGTLLSFYPENVIKIGFDPAQNLKETAQENCTLFINDYFTKDNPYFKNIENAKVITAIAMFYDLEDPNKFLQDIYASLTDDGIFVIQLTDLYSMLKVCAFDNICGEHLEYYTLFVLYDLFAANGLRIFDVSYNKVNGGSIRVFACKGDTYQEEKSVMESMNQEASYLSSYQGTFGYFSDRIFKAKDKLLSALEKLSVNGINVYGLGASTKGNTLLQVFGINTSLVKGIGEINEDKFGLYTVGSNIPIISEKEVLEANPKYILIIPWHFTNTFIKNLSTYLDNGGKFIVPLPAPGILSKEKGKLEWIYL